MYLHEFKPKWRDWISASFILWACDCMFKIWCAPCDWVPGFVHSPHPALWVLDPSVCVCVCVCVCPVMHYKDSCLFSVALFIPKLAALDSTSFTTNTCVHASKHKHAHARGRTHTHTHTQTLCYLTVYISADTHLKFLVNWLFLWLQYKMFLSSWKARNVTDEARDLKFLNY